ncbi:hypothetical protein SBV1_1850005 [Verrucomicrobia bacterium]|nr:hypothetical protein SBV1_1850005 [Verrucomicrobiota bacterium]
MPRKLRVEYPGAIYHVMSRDDGRENKSDPAKLAIAARLRKETTLTVKAIAVRLHLGTSKSANVRLSQWNRDQVCDQQNQRPSS